MKDSPPWEWPSDAGETLRAVLEDVEGEDAVRLLAADLAGEVVAMGDALARALLGVLARDAENEELRAQAAISLGPVLEMTDEDGFDEPEDALIDEATFGAIREALRGAYTNAAFPKLVRRRVLEASVRAPEEWHTKAIRAAWKSGDDEWRRTAAFGMVYLRGFDEEILEALDDADPDVRRHAVTAAGNWELKAAWKQVAAIVESSDIDRALLLAAIEAAPGVDPVRAPELLGELLDSEDEEIVEAVHEALAMAEGLSGPTGGENDDD